VPGSAARRSDHCRRPRPTITAHAPADGGLKIDVRFSRDTAHTSRAHSGEELRRTLRMGSRRHPLTSVSRDRRRRDRPRQPRRHRALVDPQQSRRRYRRSPTRLLSDSIGHETLGDGVAVRRHGAVDYAGATGRRLNRLRWIRDGREAGRQAGSPWRPRVSAPYSALSRASPSSMSSCLTAPGLGRWTRVAAQCDKLRAVARFRPVGRPRSPNHAQRRAAHKRVATIEHQ
jgi:hypothetical protein